MDGSTGRMPDSATAWSEVCLCMKKVCSSLWMWITFLSHDFACWWNVAQWLSHQPGREELSIGWWRSWENNFLPLWAEAEKWKTQRRCFLLFLGKTQHDRFLWLVGVTPTDWKGQHFHSEYRISLFPRQLKLLGKVVKASKETKKYFGEKCLYS